MRHLFSLIVLLVAAAAPAAEVTRVASSAEEGKPFGMYFDITFDRLQEKGRIVREWYGEGVAAVDHTLSELNYVKYETTLDLQAHVGLFRDLELKVDVPIVFQQDRAWSFAAGRDETNSTIFHNCVDASGGVCGSGTGVYAGTPGQGEGQLFGVPATSYRGGLGDLTLGLAWAPFVQRKDASKPTWVLRFDYTAPTQYGAKLNPAVDTSPQSRGGIGERVHKYTFSTALSRRISFAEPYFVFHYTLPWRGPGFYSNCDEITGHSEVSDRMAQSMARAQNCGTGAWTRDETGLQPPHTGGVMLGSELTVFERPEHHQRVAFDLRGWVEYVSAARVYNEVSDLLHKILATQDYGRLGAQLGFIGQAAQFIVLKASASLAYDTEHVLTQEQPALASSSSAVDLTNSPELTNPNFDYRVDRTGRRFIIKDQFLFRILVTATFAF